MPILKRQSSLWSWLIPCVGFGTDREYSDVVVNEAGSWMHEYALGTVDEVFDEE